MSEVEFKGRLAALCAEYGLEEFAVYGRYNERAPNGHYPIRHFLWNQGEPSVAEEAAYYFAKDQGLCLCREEKLMLSK